MRRRAPALILAPLLAALLAVVATELPSARAAEQRVAIPRQRLANTFAKPEEVVEYYCSRDAAGFVWTGLLRKEVSEFTEWPEAPQHDSFLVARGYKVGRAEFIDKNGQEARVEVLYDMIGLGDAHGTWVPAIKKKERVIFELRKLDGAWRIRSPQPQSLSPVIVEGRFPYPRARQ